MLFYSTYICISVFQLLLLPFVYGLKHVVYVFNTEKYRKTREIRMLNCVPRGHMGSFYSSNVGWFMYEYLNKWIPDVFDNFVLNLLMFMEKYFIRRMILLHDSVMCFLDVNYTILWIDMTSTGFSWLFCCGYTCGYEFDPVRRFYILHRCIYSTDAIFNIWHSI